METAVQLSLIISPFYIIVGLSMFINRVSWQNMIKRYRESHYSAALLFLIEATFGLIVISFYNVWEWNIWLIVTLTGWLMFMEGAAYMVLPKAWADWWLGIWHNNSLMYLFATMFVVLGIVLGYFTYLT